MFVLWSNKIIIDIAINEYHTFVPSNFNIYYYRKMVVSGLPYVEFFYNGLTVSDTDLTHSDTTLTNRATLT